MFEPTYFCLTKESHIIIYGAGGLGCSRAACLRNAGYQVTAFIDRNADSIPQISSTPVYAPDDINKKTSKKDDIVIICLHNALWHPEAAEALHALGYENIIFLPMGEQYQHLARASMEKAYGCLEDELYKQLKDLPTYSTLTKFNASIEDGVIIKTDTTVIAWMELTSIFTNELLKQRGNSITQSYGDVSVCALKPYTELFHFCKFGTGDLGLYCRAFKEVQNTKDVYSSNEFIQDRIELYEKLRLELNRGIDYFIRSAPFLKWDSGLHHFNVMEGHHRLIFLMQEGLSYVPVKISKKDFELWKNDSIYQKCQDLLKKHHISSWFTPLNHPGFYHFSSERENVSPSILMELQKKIGTCIRNDFSVLDCFELGGHFARALKSMGCENAVCYEKDSVYASVIRILNQLFYQNVTVIQKSWQTDIRNLPTANIALFSFADLPADVICEYWNHVKHKSTDYMVLELPVAEKVEALLPDCPFQQIIHLKRNVSTKTISDIWLLSAKKESYNKHG